jgi:L-rhamnose-H+ transport protein
MALTGIFFAFLSGVCNGLFTAPMKLASRWRWENIWFVFIVVACLVMPGLFVIPALGKWHAILDHAPKNALGAAVAFGFAWGFGAICFGRSVDLLGVSIANSLVIGLSSAFGSVVPLVLAGALRFDLRQGVLFAGVLAFLMGVFLCGQAGRLRDGGGGASPKLSGYLFAVGAGIMSAVFNVGYALALPVSDAGVAAGLSRFSATNFIWLLMLSAGAIPNLVYCIVLMVRNHSSALIVAPQAAKPWAMSILMGILWSGSIFLYGAATPRLGDIGPSIGWPLSLAVGLLVANLMGTILGEWRGVSPVAIRKMKTGVATLVLAIVLCAASTRIGS